MVPTRNNEWTCCCGMHVRIASIMIGLWHLFLNVLTLGVLASVVRNSYKGDTLQGDYDEFNHMKEVLPTPLSNHLKHGSRDDLNSIRCVCMIAASLLVIHGASKYKASCLVPILFAQVIDFAASAASVINNPYYLSWTVMDGDEYYPAWRHELSKLNPEFVSLMLLVLPITIVLCKGYAIGVLWRCYKYLTMRRSIMLPYVIPMISAQRGRDYNNLLPDFEEMLVQSLKRPPPPYYQEAILSTPLTNTHQILPNTIPNTSHSNTFNGATSDTSSIPRLPSSVVTHVAFVDKYNNRIINQQQ